MRSRFFGPAGRAAGLLALLALGLAACESAPFEAGRGTGSLVAQALWPGQTTILAAAAARTPLAAPPSVSSVVVTVTVNGVTFVSPCFAAAAGGAQIDNVPSGTGTAVSLTAYNAACPGTSGLVMYRGGPVSVSVPPGGITPPVKVFMVADATNNPAGAGWGPALVWDDTTNIPPTTWDNAVWQ
jgi:hypothetical protein